MRLRGVGFTILELLIALAVITSGVFVALGVFTSVLRASQESVQTGTGAVVARSMLNQELHRIWQGDESVKKAFFEKSAPPSAPIVGTTHLHGTTFTYLIYHQTLPDLGDAPGGNRLKKVDIVVKWWDSDPTRQGYGQQLVSFSRLVNQNSDL